MLPNSWYNTGNFKAAATGVTSTRHSLTMLHVGGVTMATADSTSNPPRQLSFTDGYQIPLTQGQVAVVDLEDADLAQFKWCVAKSKDIRYAHRSLNRVGKQRRDIRMHRLILERVIGRELNADEYPDHINGDGLDNRRSNLRVASRQQNARNRRLRADNRSGLKGVSFDKKTKRWKAQINNDRKQIVLGYFDAPEQAHAAYCEAAKKYHGEFARLS